MYTFFLVIFREAAWFFGGNITDFSIKFQYMTEKKV